MCTTNFPSFFPKKKRKKQTRTESKKGERQLSPPNENARSKDRDCLRIGFSRRANVNKGRFSTPSTVLLTSLVANVLCSFTYLKISLRTIEKKREETYNRRKPRYISRENTFFRILHSRETLDFPRCSKRSNKTVGYSPLLPVGVGADVDLPVGSGIGNIRSQHSLSGNSLARVHLQQQKSRTRAAATLVSSVERASSVPTTRDMTRPIRS